MGHQEYECRALLHRRFGDRNAKHHRLLAAALAVAFTVAAGSMALAGGLSAYVPLPAMTTPPSVSVDGATGTDTTSYALANHTHATSVQRMTLTISPTGQPVRWTFAKPYDAGVVPVVVCTAQNTATATRPFVVNTVGDATTTYVDLIVFQAAQPTISILGAAVTLFGAASTGTKVNCQAAKPTQ